MQFIISRFNKFVCFLILPVLWPSISSFLHTIAKRSVFIEPRVGVVDKALILSPKKSNIRKKSLNYNLLAANWASCSLDIPEIQYLTELSSYKGEALIITNDWFKSTKQHLYFFIPAIVLACRIRKKRGFVWVLIGDTCNLKIVIPASILVSICGGAVVLQQNTQAEGANFGIPHVSGPHFWYITSINLDDFYSNKTLLLRPKRLIVGVSGDELREDIFKQVKKSLVNSDYELIPTRHQYDWPQYMDLLKSARVNIASSLIPSRVKKQNKFIERRLPEFVITNRIWEGFCSGAVVITQKNLILDCYGLKAGVHYLDLGELESMNFKLPIDAELQKIASEGQTKFIKDVVLLN